MKDFICRIPSGNSAIFDKYLNFLDNFSFGIIVENSPILNSIFNIISEHGFISYHYFSAPFGNNNFTENSTFVYWIAFYSVGIILGIILDLVFYFLGKYFSNFLKFKYESKNLFYIFFRFVPIIGNFSVFIGSIFDKHNLKKDFIKITIGNILFISTNFILGFIVYKICGKFWL